ncbi:MAG: iron(III) transport system substrate-binding protein [Alphaproteobacteria bacterium]|jgi:iron(III) transport system substrate-binding protein
MTMKRKTLTGLSLAAMLGFGLSQTMIMSPAAAADLPAATKAALKQLKLDASILSGLDEELKTPADWRVKAKKEGALDIIGAWDPPQFRKIAAPFKARFPEVKISYVRGGLYDRGVKTLLALRQGRFLADIIISAGGNWIGFKDMNALEDLRVLPNYKRLDKITREPNGLWVGQKIAYRCMVYNTKQVKKSELPKTWDDLITSPRWRNGKLGVPNRPSLWLSMLWLKKGPEWTKNFMTKIFTVVKPQLRKEGANAMIALTVAGEFDAAVGAAEYRILQYQQRGAPAGFHCPTPVPLAITAMIVLKDNPHKYSSLIFTNWFISKEGQIAQYAANNAIPVRSDLASRKEFMPFPEEVMGKPLAIRDEGKLVTEYAKMMAYYNPLWKKAGGGKSGKLTTIKVKLTGIKRSGRIISYNLKGKPSEITISGRRTVVTINGAKVKRNKLKPGMTCEITASKGASAASVECKK